MATGGGGGGWRRVAATHSRVAPGAAPPSTIHAQRWSCPRTCAGGVYGGGVAGGPRAYDAHLGAQLFESHGCCCAEQAGERGLQRDQTAGRRSEIRMLVGTCSLGAAAYCLGSSDRRVCSCACAVGPQGPWNALFPFHRPKSATWRIASKEGTHRASPAASALHRSSLSPIHCTQRHTSEHPSHSHSSPFLPAPHQRRHDDRDSECV